MNIPKKQNKKIVICYVSVGSGHKFAAIPLQKAIQSCLDKDFSVELIDAIDFFKKTTKIAFHNSQKILTGIIGKIYNYLWQSKIFIPSEEKLDWIILLFSQNFKKYLLDTRPRIIISVHGLPAILVSHLKKRNLLPNTIHIAVNTDFRAHSYWPLSGVDFYFAASEPAKQDLIKMGIPASKVEISGIPIRSQFLEKLPEPEILKKEFTETKLPVVLFLAGSLQKGLYEHIIKKLYKILDSLDESSNFFLFILTGSDTELKNKLDTYIQKKKIKNVKVFGFIKKINRLLGASNLLVTKPGGLISSEALAMGLPMLILGPNFGQEKGNAKYFIKERVAVMLKKNEKITKKIDKIISDPKTLAQMANNAKKIAKPKSAQKIANLVKQLIQ